MYVPHLEATSLEGRHPKDGSSAGGRLNKEGSETGRSLSSEFLSTTLGTTAAGDEQGGCWRAASADFFVLVHQDD